MITWPVLQRNDLSLEAQQQAAALRIEGAEPAGVGDLHIAAGEFLMDQRRQLYSGAGVVGVGNTHFAAVKARLLHGGEETVQSLFLSTAFVERLQRTLVTGLHLRGNSIFQNDLAKIK